jgi:hypothetical protein
MLPIYEVKQGFKYLLLLPLTNLLRIEMDPNTHEFPRRCPGLIRNYLGALGYAASFYI